MGGAAAVIEKARRAFEDGDYRWAATMLDHLVFAEPGHDEAREWLARSYEQLGYQAESAPWRDVYLTGAHELRHGAADSAIDPAIAANLLRAMPVHRFFDAMATRIDSEKAAGAEYAINFVFTDLGESYRLTLANAVLNYRRGDPDPEADATFRVTRDLWLEITTGQAGLREMLFSDAADIEGSRLKLLGFFRLLDNPTGAFPIVTP